LKSVVIGLASFAACYAMFAKVAPP
jgi:hypothetical protein